MALLFDVAVVFIIFTAALQVVPGLVDSNYQDNEGHRRDYESLQSAQDDIDSANKDIKSAESALEKAQTNGKTSAERSAEADLEAAQSDLKSAQSDFGDAAKDLRKDGLPTPHDSDAIQKERDRLAREDFGPLVVGLVAVLVLALLYLVPMTAITGRTLGMRGRRLRVVKLDFTPVGWLGAFLRFFVPIALALALYPYLGPVGPILGLGMVLWAFRDPNGQGLHDKLARTFVVADDR
jgi:hypothetical protein